MLGGQFMLYSIHERAFVRVPGVPDDLPEQLDQALACLADVDKGVPL